MKNISCLVKFKIFELHDTYLYFRGQMAYSEGSEYLLITMMELNCVMLFDMTNKEISDYLGKCYDLQSEVRYSGHRLEEFRGRVPYGVAFTNIDGRSIIFVSFRDDGIVVVVDDDIVTELATVLGSDFMKLKTVEFDEDTGALYVIANAGILEIPRAAHTGEIKLTDEMLVYQYGDDCVHRTKMVQLHKSLWIISVCNKDR